MPKIGNKNNNNTSVPTLAEYITTQIANKRAVALDKSRNRTSVKVPMIPNSISEEDWKTVSFYAYRDTQEEAIAARQRGNIELAEELERDMQRYKNNYAAYSPMVPGANCMYNAGDCYGLNIPGNQTFATKHKEKGFKRVDSSNMEPGDIVQATNHYGIPQHAMIFDSKDKNDKPLYNYAKGNYFGDFNRDYVKQGHYPMTNNPLVYRYVGTPADSTQWINEYKQKYGNGMRCGGRRKAQLGLDIREGGIAQPIANNMWYIHGRKHEYGGVTMGPNNKNGVEVEGGEVVEMIDSNHPSVGRQFKAGGQKQTMRVFSSVPFLRGASPAELVLGGANPDAVFKAQEEFKDRNRINDDGTTYEMGGEGKSKSKRSRPVTGVLPYGYTIRNLYAVENPYRKGIKGNVAKMYDSRTLGAGVDVVSGHPELYKKAKSGKITKKQADETAVVHLRKDDNAIRSNYADVYGKAAADTLSYGPRFLVAQARYQQGNVRKAWQPIHKAMAKGDAKALKKAILQVTPKDHTYRRKWIEDFKVYKMGGMIYEINGNVRNGLGLRSKAKYGKEYKHKKVEGYGNTVVVDDVVYSVNNDGVFVPIETAKIDKQSKTVRGASTRRDIAYDRQGNRYQRRSDGTLLKISPKNNNHATSINLDEVVITANKIDNTSSSLTEGKKYTSRGSKNYVYDEEGNRFYRRSDGTLIKSGQSSPQSLPEVVITGTKPVKKETKIASETTTKTDNKSYTINGKDENYLTGQRRSANRHPIPDFIGEVTNSEVKKTKTKTTTSSTPRKGRNQAATTSKPTAKSTPTIQDTVNKITMDALKASKTPNIDLSKAKMPSYNVSDLGSKESKAAKTKLNSSSTGSGTQSKDGRWIGQYKTTNVGDWIGLGSNLAGHIASYFMTKNAINKMSEPIKSIMAQAAKLKTRYNVEPQLTEIREAEQMNRAAVRRNTQSSNTSLAREQRLMNEARGARNTLYGQKENIETQLINQDRLNRQSVMRDNVRAYNEYLNKVTATKMAQNEMRASNINNLISGLTGSVTSILGNIESRRATNNTLRAIAAANPNVDARLIGGFDYYIDPITKKKYNKNQQYVGTING